MCVDGKCQEAFAPTDDTQSIKDSVKQYELFYHRFHSAIIDVVVIVIVSVAVVAVASACIVAL